MACTSGQSSSSLPTKSMATPRAASADARPRAYGLSLPPVSSATEMDQLQSARCRWRRVPATCTRRFSPASDERLTWSGSIAFKPRCAPVSHRQLRPSPSGARNIVAASTSRNPKRRLNCPSESSVQNTYTRCRDLPGAAELHGLGDQRARHCLVAMLDLGNDLAQVGELPRPSRASRSRSARPRSTRRSDPRETELRENCRLTVSKSLP